MSIKKNLEEEYQGSSFNLGILPTVKSRMLRTFFQKCIACIKSCHCVLVLSESKDKINAIPDKEEMSNS